MKSSQYIDFCVHKNLRICNKISN